MIRDMTEPPSALPGRWPRESRQPGEARRSQRFLAPSVDNETLQRKSRREAPSFCRVAPIQIQMDFCSQALGPETNPRRQRWTARNTQVARWADNRPKAGRDPLLEGLEEHEPWMSDSLETWVGGLLVVLVGLVSAALAPL